MENDLKNALLLLFLRLNCCDFLSIGWLWIDSYYKDI